MKGRHNMKRTKRNVGEALTAEEALQILQSAIGYCQQAGLAVQAANSGTGLTLTIPGAYYTATDERAGVTFHIGTPEPTKSGDLPEKQASVQS
jgi:hypothetical protein